MRELAKDEHRFVRTGVREATVGHAQARPWTKARCSSTPPHFRTDASADLKHPPSLPGRLCSPPYRLKLSAAKFTQS